MPPRCGRCRGRGEHRPIGLGPDVTCEDCGGTGEKQPPKPKRRIDVDYDTAAEHCRFEGVVPGRECYGIKTWHHIVPKGKIVARLTSGKWVDKELAEKIAAAVADPRDLIDACFGCHLGLIETANPDALEQIKKLLPAGFADFVAEYELEADVPRHLQEVIRAAGAQA